MLTIAFYVYFDLVILITNDIMDNKQYSILYNAIFHSFYGLSSQILSQKDYFKYLLIGRHKTLTKNTDQLFFVFVF